MNRREFFKKAAKRVLPFVGVITGMILPMPKAKAAPNTAVDGVAYILVPVSVLMLVICPV